MIFKQAHGQGRQHMLDRFCQCCTLTFVKRTLNARGVRTSNPVSAVRDTSTGTAMSICKAQPYQTYETLMAAHNVVGVHTVRNLLLPVDVW
jgi:hypothetical protein